MSKPHVPSRRFRAVTELMVMKEAFERAGASGFTAMPEDAVRMLNVVKEAITLLDADVKIRRKLAAKAGLT
jgi:hypothetical protein